MLKLTINNSNMYEIINMYVCMYNNKKQNFFLNSL